MTDSPKRNVCFYCRCQLKEGEGRYRFFHGDKQVECCPLCFDETRHLNLRQPVEPGRKSKPHLEEKES